MPYEAPSTVEDAPSRTHAPRSYLPLGIDVAGLRCLVVGGGRIGARKALTLATPGAAVTVLSPEISDRLRPAVEQGTVRWQQRRYDSGCLDGFVLVVAATDDPALNIEIGRDAEQRGILHCVVSPGRFSRIIFPAVHEHDGVAVAVHTNGRDCARARQVRDRIAAMLERQGTESPELTVVGITRADVPPELFERLTARTNGHLLAEDALVLRTCQRWECYGSAPHPPAFARDVRRAVQERCGVLLESHPRAVFLKRGVKAFHHLLRVASGLGSPLVGETEIVAQIRAAVSEHGGADASLVVRAFESALRAQQAVRKRSGLRPERGGWAAAVVSLLAARGADLTGRTAALVGCGRLAESIAQRLIARGATVLPVSRRAGTAGGVPWCAKSKLRVIHPQDMRAALPGVTDVVLSSAPPLDVEDCLLAAVRDRRITVVDLTAHGLVRAGRESARGYFTLDDVGSASLTAESVARIARAERLCVENALRWHKRKALAVPAPALLVLGGRGSELSRVQLAEVEGFLHMLSPATRVRTVTVDTPGDRDKQTPLPDVAQDDFFTRDLDDALLAGRIDVAVHSAKDLPERLPDGLAVATLTPSFAPWDVLVSRRGKPLDALPTGSVVGTSSGRRRDALMKLRPDLVARKIRGNVPDRLDQLDAGRYDALILAAAGLIRLDRTDRIAQVFSPREVPIAPGQGALAIVVRKADTELRRFLEPLDLGDRRGLPWA